MLGALLLSPHEAANALGVCRSTVYNMLASGQLRSVRVRRARRIPMSEIERIISEGVVTS